MIDDLLAHSGSLVQCEDQTFCQKSSGSIGTYTSESPCEYVRKLCVTCHEDEDTSDVYITVQSNGLPNHCDHLRTHVDIDTEQVWTAVFNADVVSSIDDNNFRTSSSDVAFLRAVLQ